MIAGLWFGSGLELVFSIIAGLKYVKDVQTYSMFVLLIVLILNTATQMFERKLNNKC